MKLIFAILAILSPASLLAANGVALTSSVFVEKTVADGRGHSRIELSEPKLVVPGDRLVFILSYRNLAPTPATNFIITNPLPGPVAFQGTPDPRAEVSVDGGRAWGRLAELKVTEKDGTERGARPEDVTHVRWALKQAIPVGAQGKLSFRGIVR
jgi:uncharacterized repeat protein (TIGR01451 family)